VFFSAAKERNTMQVLIACFTCCASIYYIVVIKYYLRQHQYDESQQFDFETALSLRTTNLVILQAHAPRQSYVVDCSWGRNSSVKAEISAGVKAEIDGEGRCAI